MSDEGENLSINSEHEISDQKQEFEENLSDEEDIEDVDERVLVVTDKENLWQDLDQGSSDEVQSLRKRIGLMKERSNGLNTSLKKSNYDRKQYQ